MFRIVALLCLVAPVFSLRDLKWEKGLKVRYDDDPISISAGKAFMDLPQSKDSAKEMGWEQTPKPDLQAEFASLELWCPTCNEVCVLFDDTGYVAGMLLALNMKQYTNAIYDWTTQGFKTWNRINKNGKSEEYKYTVIYFSSHEYLKKSAEARIAARNPEKLLQDKNIYVSGINGELHPISTDVTEIGSTSISNFTMQACMPGMGIHYYYEMSETKQCNDQLFPFLLLMSDDTLVGLSFIVFGKYETQDGCTTYFEAPLRDAVETIVPRGPECLYDLADTPGLVTLHIYFTKSPTDIEC